MQVAEREPREVCWRCARPRKVCWCAHVPKLEASTRVLFLQHPREEFMPIGTARMAAACLPDAEIVVGTELDEHPAVRRALEDKERPAVLLWPGPGAKDLAVEPPTGPVTLIVVDGTWSLAKKLVRINPRVASLPRYALSPERPSEYRIRREPRAECVSTLEAVMYALGALEGDPSRFSAMLAPFAAMIEAQLAHEDLGEGRRARRLRGPRPRVVPAAIREGRSLVVVAGEANAWARKTEPGRLPAPPDELVQWLAVRVSDGARFEAIVAPTNPLCPMTPVHTRLEEAQLRAGGTMSELLERWRAFVRDDDVLCGWGCYAPSLLARHGGVVPRGFVDLRVAATRFLRDKPGSLEEHSERIGWDGSPLGAGRGGRRLAMALAVTRQLVAAAPQSR